MPGSNVHIEIIHGINHLGERITLENCWQIKSPMNFRNIFVREAQFDVENIYVGQHFNTPAQIQFDSLIVELTNLTNWLGLGRFHNDLDTDNKLGTIKLEYAEPELASSIQNMNIRISSSVKFEPTLTSFSESHLYHDSAFILTPKSPLSFKQYMDVYVYNLQNFLTLATYRPAIPTSIIGTIRTSSSDKNATSSAKRIRVFSKFANVENKPIDRRFMLFRFEEVEEIITECLEKWFDKSKEYKHVFDLYFGLFYVPPIYINLEFLILAQTIETYHRDFHEGKYVSKEDYQKYYEAMYNALPDDINSRLKNRLKGFLQYGYEFSLRTRLKHLLNEVLSEYKDEMNNLIGRFKDFVNKVTETRNYYTHYTDSKYAVTDPGQLYYLAQKLKIILQICFLIELGIPSDKIREMITSSSAYKRLVK